MTAKEALKVPEEADDRMLKHIARAEDNFVERKPESVSPGELRQTICAFANSLEAGRVAFLVIGVHDKTGEVFGVENTDNIQKRVGEVCRDHCYPPVDFQAEVFEVHGKKVVVVTIPASTRKPHFSGPAYVRQGSESVKASPEQYEKLILSRTDKAAAILAMAGAVITVLGIGYKVGSNKPLPEAAYKEMRECKLVDCTAHVVTLEDIGKGLRISEPLERVTVSYDEERRRPMLMISFR